ncbi:unnamed protein product, partial [Trichobilharzia regenti]
MHSPSDNDSFDSFAQLLIPRVSSLSIPIDCTSLLPPTELLTASVTLVPPLHPPLSGLFPPLASSVSPPALSVECRGHRSSVSLHSSSSSLSVSVVRVAAPLPSLPVVASSCSNIDAPVFDVHQTLILNAVFSQLNNDSRLLQPSLLLDCIKSFAFGDISREALSSFIEEHAEKVFPIKWRPSKMRCPPDNFHNLSSRLKRRFLYAHIQALFAKSPKDAAATVIDGRWRNPFVTDPQSIPDFNEFWLQIFCASSVIDERPIIPVIPTNDSLIAPLIANDITWALKDMRHSACGVDRIFANDLLKCNPNVVAGYLNLLLLANYVPKNLATARVTFIPKCESSFLPADFRPISITPAITRCFHKVLAKRWMTLFPHDKNQFAFLQKDGCFEATNLLHAILRESHTKYTPCSIAILDVSKAFDSVSHDTILRAAERFGGPQILCKYLAAFYGQSTSLLNATSCAPARGVKQGDPLSPLLFIMVLDEALSAIDQESPLFVGGHPIHYIAYADDLLLFAPDANSLQRKLDILAYHLSLAGLQTNPAKSMTIDIVSSGKSKIAALAPTVFSINSIPIPALSVTDNFNYLGIPFNYKGRISCDYLSILRGYTDNVTAAPLKPHQRVHIIRQTVVPRLQHILTLGVVHKKTLLALDRHIRLSIRSWLRLPKDTPVAYFYTPIRDGGLGIPHLSSMIPLHRRKRSEKLLSSSNPCIRWAATSPHFAPFLRIANLPIPIHHESTNSIEENSIRWRRQLYATLDGKGLQEAPKSTISSRWLMSPTSVFPRLYIRGIQLR